MNIHAVGVHTARPAEGGCTRGVSAERFETPLVGRAACFWRRGGNPPAPAFPRRGKRERGRSNLLAAAGICLRITPEYRPLTPSPQALTATQKPEFPQISRTTPDSHDLMPEVLELLKREKEMTKQEIVTFQAEV